MLLGVVEETRAAPGEDGLFENLGSRSAAPLCHGESAHSASVLLVCTCIQHTNKCLCQNALAYVVGRYRQAHALVSNAGSIVVLVELVRHTNDGHARHHGLVDAVEAAMREEHSHRLVTEHPRLFHFLGEPHLSLMLARVTPVTIWEETLSVHVVEHCHFAGDTAKPTSFHRGAPLSVFEQCLEGTVDDGHHASSEDLRAAR
mmetsp:Transcript_1327/g.4782  ORF Transcript_1327/g.4782 Transcript_1327/m.4782 type:complete len:202 (-) Transcript_1327:688-1293(-)